MNWSQATAAGKCKLKASSDHQPLLLPLHSPPPAFAGKLHFVKFETAKVDDCIAFIEAKGGARCRPGYY